jgi:uroporphyrinogen decarboxylase
MSSDKALKNDLLLRVARGEAVPRPPVWLMRQAGRFLTEYRAVRAQVNSFGEMIAHPELAAEVTLQPVDLIGVDAAIIFSDILVVPEALGLPYQMVSGEGPRFKQTIRSASDLATLHPVTGESNLDFTYEAIRLTLKTLDQRVPLIGFAGAPWTIFCYMVEGSGSKTFSQAKAMLYQAPELAHQLLQLITDATIHYLQQQIACGVHLVQVFDSWAGVLNQETYGTFALPYLQQICDTIQAVPKIIFAKGAFFSLEPLFQLDCEIIGLDWQTPLDHVLPHLGSKALQGNLDPCQLYASPEEVATATQAMLDRFPAQRHVANLGHGIYPDLPRESVQSFVDTVKRYTYPSSA